MYELFIGAVSFMAGLLIKNHIDKSSEHKYFKKRFTFEVKYPVYQELYKSSKKVHGYLKGFSEFNSFSTNFISEAVNSFESDTSFKYLNFNYDTYKDEDSVDYRRYMNFVFYLYSIERFLLDFQNESSGNSIILSDELNRSSDTFHKRASYILDKLKKTFEEESNLKKIKVDYNRIFYTELESDVKQLRNEINVMFEDIKQELSIE